MTVKCSNRPRRPCDRPRGVATPGERCSVPDATHETWRPVIGWERLYEVSDLGHVRSLGARARTLKPQDRKGYRKVTLYRGDGHPLQVNVSVLVLEAFTCPRPPGEVVRHGPAGRMSDAVSNLTWGTHQQNQGTDRVRDRTRHLCGRQRSLSADAVAQACELRSAGLSFEEIGRHFGVAMETARRAIRGLASYRKVT